MFVATLLCTATLAAAPQTVDELWAGYDPRALALHSETVQEWRENGTVIRKVFYTSEHTSELAGDFDVRVVAYFGFPLNQDAKKLPGILHIHGGGQTATREYVEYWARRGYAALSINWGGVPIAREETKNNTDWGPLAASQNNVANTYKVSPDARVNSWYHWTIACRRGLTFLEQQPEVDASRLAIFGISMGGRLTWLVAATDARVKAAASLYGAVAMTEPLPGIPGSEQLRIAQADDPIWRATLDATAYAPRVRCPFFYLSASDDFYGAMDFVDRAMGTIPHKDHWRSFTPHFNHHVAPEQSAALPLWMDRWLKGGAAWPRTPRITLDRKGAVVAPDRAAEVRAVTVYYSTGTHPQSRFWRSAEVATHGKKWTATLPLLASEREMKVFANVLYESGLSLSTPLAAGAGKGAEEPALLVDDFSHGGRDWFVILAGPNPLYSEKHAFVPAKGQAGAKALAPHPDQGADWRFSTRKVGDPKWRGPAGASLQFQIHSETSGEIQVAATENEYFRPKETRVFLASVRVQGKGWETVTLPLSAFRVFEGEKQLASWQEVNLLTIAAQYTDRIKRTKVGQPWRGPVPAIARVEWVKP